MPIFNYSAKDPAGKMERGVAQGASLADVAGRLSERGLSVVEIALAPDGLDEPQVKAPPPTEARSRVQTEVVGRAIGGVPLHVLHFFFRQLGVMLNAGINPADALETLSRQSTSAKLREVLAETKDHVIAGRPMTTGFQRYPEVFTPLMMSMLRVGEQSGSLPEQCRQLSEYIQRDIELRNTIRRETAMPKLTVFMSAVIILGANALITAINPSAMRLPVPAFLWFIAIVGGAATWFFVKFMLPQPRVRRSFDEFVLALPWIGPMVHGFAMAKFGRAFGALYQSGVALPEALRLASDATANEAVRAKVEPAEAMLKEGKGVTDTLMSTGAFSPIVLDMTRTGETTGNLDEMLVKASEFYEDEGATKAQMAAKIIGVLCLLAVAVYVAYVLISFYGGYFAGITSQAGS